MAGRAKTPEERAAKLAAAKASGKSLTSPRHENFRPGNEMAVTHGARAVITIADVVEQRVIDFLNDPDRPEYAKKPAQREALISWVRFGVRIDRLNAVVDQMDDIMDAITELQETTEEVTGSRDSKNLYREAATRKRADILETIRKQEMARLNYARELGLTAASQAKMGKDVASTQIDLAKLIEQANRDAKRS